MDDLISRAAAIEMIKTLSKWRIILPENPRITQTGFMADDVRFGLDKVPAVDAVPVVRCEHCRYGEDYPPRPEMIHCTHACCPDLLVRRDWYCADGERRDEDAERNANE